MPKVTDPRVPVDETKLWKFPTEEPDMDWMSVLTVVFAMMGLWLKVLSSLNNKI
jgi:hypothetical protein